MVLTIAVGFAGIAVLLSRYVGRFMPRRDKMVPYESGMDPQGDSRNRYSVKFYLVAMLFILFDIEVVFLYPWAVRFHKLGLFGLVEMGVFLVILLVGYFYIIGSGALDWDKDGLKTRDGENG